MTHSDKGHYANKHKGVEIDEAAAALLKSIAENNNLSCASAHKAAKQLGITPQEAGVQADLLEYRITLCQLGLFGYRSGEKLFDPEIDIPHDMDKAIESIKDDGRVSCLECWDIARKLKSKKIDVSSACEKKGLRIKPCQLGAF